LETDKVKGEMEKIIKDLGLDPEKHARLVGKIEELSITELASLFMTWAIVADERLNRIESTLNLASTYKDMGELARYIRRQRTIPPHECQWVPRQDGPGLKCKICGIELG